MNYIKSFIDTNNSGIALHSTKFRINLKKNGEPLPKNEDTRAASTDFEDGFTTTDELDDEIIENRLYLYKGKYKSWRIGPDLGVNSCWMYSTHVEEKDDFLNQARSYYAEKGTWWEAGKRGWSESGMLEIRYFGIPTHDGRTQLYVSGVFNTKWKSNAIAGLYDEFHDEEHGTYWRRMCLVRGRPCIAKFPQG